MMMAVYDHDNHHRPFPDHDHHDGPTSNTALYRSNDIYDVGAAAVRTTLQPFDSSSSSTYAAYKSPGGMAASLGFPFTNAQWKELERQAMIYKYMVASVPIPLDLLLPITRNFSATSASAVSQSPLGGGDFKLRFSNGTDPEPGRCKRTDGKKWRCSRDVAPGQKYCERHMHRGRPRSRKHVELQVNNNNNKRTRHDHHQPLPSSSPATLAHSHPTINNTTSQTQFFAYTPLPHNPSAFESVTSSLDWTMKEEPVSMAASDPRWLHLMQARMDLTSKPSFCNTNSSVFTHQEEEEPFLNLNSYTNFNPGEDEQERDCSLFLNPDFVSIETQNPTQSHTPKSFIDAWSKTIMEENMSCVSSNGGLSPSSLTLSMGGFGSNGEMGQSQLSSGSHFTNWLTPGGPLAEVLRPSSVSAATGGVSDPSSPFTVNGGDSGSRSPLATAVSSPSGVLQKTFGSMSDSSVCSSPKVGGSKAKAEIALF
ncbi:hypothetical protein UlMin_024251 [Ulmus minor]